MRSNNKPNKLSGVLFITKYCQLLNKKNSGIIVMKNLA